MLINFSTHPDLHACGIITTDTWNCMGTLRDIENPHVYSLSDKTVATDQQPYADRQPSSKKQNTDKWERHMSDFSET